MIAFPLIALNAHSLFNYKTRMRMNKENPEEIVKCVVPYLVLDVQTGGIYL